MSTEEQEKIIAELRQKSVKIEFKEATDTSKLDKKAVWAKAQKAGKTISDDDLPAGHPEPA